MNRYLVFGISSQLGGVESFLLNYVNEMKDSDNVFEFIIFDSVPLFFKMSKLKDCKVHIVPTRTKHPIAYVMALKKILENNKYDALWYNVCSLSDITLLQLAKKYKIPCRIVHGHTNSNMGGRLVGLLHDIHKRKVGKYATDYFACTVSAGEYMFSITDEKSKRVRVINNAINVEEYKYNYETRQRMRSELGIKNEFLLGHVGRFHFEKNHFFIIDVMEKLLEKNPESKLLLVGTGPLKNQVIDKIKDKGFLNKTIILENRKDIGELLQAIDSFIFPSLFEGLPLALIEAQAADLPCIISNVIPHVAVLTEKVYPLSLKEDVQEWAEVILNKSKGDCRKDRSELIRNEGFDLKGNALALKIHLKKRIEECSNVE